MTGMIKLGDVHLTRHKPILTTATNSGTIYPVTIGFAKDLSDRKLQQLAALAKWLQDKEDEDDKGNT